jgi:uncharacterized protein (DUF2147 family)
MMLRQVLFLVAGAFFVSLIGAVTGPAALAQQVLGVWTPEERDSEIEIAICEGGKICGRIISLTEPLNEEGTERLDINNKDASLWSRPIMGLELLTGFAADGETKWKGGRIYNPRDGKTYKSTLTLNADGTLKVRGYIGIPALGQTQLWSRVR